MSVIKFPTKDKPKHRSQIVRARELYCQGDMPEQMVWDMCAYTKQYPTDTACKECTRFEEDPDVGKVQRGCFTMAQEACRLAMAWAERIKHGGPYE